MAELTGNMSGKKVEYIELIYDLIFVYLLGRSNALLHSAEGGFPGGGAWFTYLISTLVILQVWYFSSLYINRCGTNGVWDHLFLFVNMYLLYYLADGTRLDWDGHFIRYNAAWGLLLVNHALAYLRQLRRGTRPVWEQAHLRCHFFLLLGQAVVVFAAIPLYGAVHFPLSWLSLLLGFAASFFTHWLDRLVPVEPEHLTERVMLLVVFTFGESIVSLAGYFTGPFGVNTLYFSLTGFLIVAGLLVSYGYLYNHVIDRERTDLGNGYMLLHIVVIVALNNITVALEFMREPEVDDVGKNVLIVASFLLYYIFLSLIAHYAKRQMRGVLRSFLGWLLLSLLFAAAMALTYRNGRLSIGISVLYVYAMFAMLVLRRRRALRDEAAAG